MPVCKGGICIGDVQMIPPIRVGFQLVIHHFLSMLAYHYGYLMQLNNNIVDRPWICLTQKWHKRFGRLFAKQNIHAKSKVHYGIGLAVIEYAEGRLKGLFKQHRDNFIGGRFVAPVNGEYSVEDKT